MVYRYPHAAPQSQLAAEKQGRRIGYFCHACQSFYPEHQARHTGKPLYGKDHIASTCGHEGEAFTAGATWWEPAVEVLSEALASHSELVANSPAKGTEPEAAGAAKK